MPLKLLIRFIWLRHFGVLEIHIHAGCSSEHFNENKFKHSYCDFVNPLCSSNKEPETKCNYLPCRHLFHIGQRTSLNLNNTKEINEHIITYHENNLDKILFYGNGSFNYDTKGMILLVTN